jgi:hypothetical protein
MRDGGGIERLRFAHPLGHEPLLTGIGHEPIMGYAGVVLLRTHHGPLPVQRMVRIVNDNVIALVMGSMQILRSVDPNEC